MKKITAVMPIKLNNERLPGKNTKLLGNKPLIQYQLEILKNIKDINDTYVFCSSDKIKKYLPANIHYLKRDPILDYPTSNFTQIFSSFMGKIDSDIYVYAHATAPFVTSSTIIECINAVISGKYDSAFCAVKIQDYLWIDGKPLNFDASNLPRSQDLKPIYRETSGVYVFKKEVFLKSKRRVGDNPYIKEVSFKESIDINTEDDFRLAEIFLNQEAK